MIFIDGRAGSIDLIEPLRKLNIPVEKTTLEYADLMWEGRGEKGKAVSVGIEFKKLDEFIAALRSNRLQGYQMVGMRQLYDYSYLFIEGELLYDHSGRLMKRKGKRSAVPMPGQMSVLELLKRKNVLHLCGGLTPTWTVNRKDTLQEIIALYRTWTDQDLDKHKSHIAAYEAPSLTPVSDFRRAVKTWPHVGMKASLAVEKYFEGSIKSAVMAPPQVWANIQIAGDKGKPRKIGIKSAEAICAFLKGVK